jgi:hypothetical protein
MALVVILPIGALMVAVLRSEYGAATVGNQITQEQIDRNLEQQALQLQYDSIKTLINQERDNLRAQTNDFARDVQQQEIVAKYDEVFFDEFNTMLDNTVDPQQLSDFLFEQFGEYEYSLLIEALGSVTTDVGIEIDLNAIALRGTAWLKFCVEISSSILGGAIASAVVKAVVQGALTPLITTFVTSLSAAFSAAAPIIGTILGFLVGAGIGITVYNLVKGAFELFFGALGGGNNYHHYWDWTLFEKSAWWMPNAKLTLNVTKIVVGLIINKLPNK